MFSPNEISYQYHDDIKIYDGTTKNVLIEQTQRINYLNQLLADKEKIFTALQPSTLTAQGEMSGVTFIESELIHRLTEPTDHILLIGCNYGEIKSQSYNPPEIKKNTGRGRKPKEKIKSKRKIQGNGKYFSSQITFLIRHPDTAQKYKIKLFRNGVFQVPGITNPNMTDLVKPIKILRDYLTINFNREIVVQNFMPVMRNYKSSLINTHYHVDLEKIKEIISNEKKNSNYINFIKKILNKYDSISIDKIITLLRNYNPLNIAEMTYNTDRCFSLIIKFYRPSVIDNDKKTTVKLLKKGKINFDGGNSEIEVKELYLWLEYIYNKYKKQILLDVRTITNSSSSSDSELNNGYKSIYDEDIQDSNSDNSDNDENYNNKKKKVILKPKKYVIGDENTGDENDASDNYNKNDDDNYNKNADYNNDDNNQINNDDENKNNINKNYNNEEQSKNNDLIIQNSNVPKDIVKQIISRNKK